MDDSATCCSCAWRSPLGSAELGIRNEKKKKLADRSFGENFRFCEKMFSYWKVFISEGIFTFAANLAGEFANFANSNTHPLAKRHLTGGYNICLFTFSRGFGAGSFGYFARSACHFFASSGLFVVVYSSINRSIASGMRVAAYGG